MDDIPPDEQSLFEEKRVWQTVAKDANQVRASASSTLVVLRGTDPGTLGAESRAFSLGEISR